MARASAALLVGAFAAMTIAGCQLPGPDVAVDVRSREDVRFVVKPRGTDNFCLDTVRIERVGDGEGRVVWEARRGEPVAGARCKFGADFPRVPSGFVETRPATSLPPGRYRVILFGGLTDGVATFDVP